jgi:hypothetical protein
VVLPHDKQQRLLEIEGVVFGDNRRCDLQTFLWIPRERDLPRRKRTSKVTLFKKKASAKGVKK